MNSEKALREALEPCPLCGGDELSHGFVEGGGVHWGTAGCEACDLQVTKATEAEAIAAWNRRALAKPSPAPVEREGEDELTAMLSCIQREEGVTIFEHTAEEIGLVVMEHHAAILSQINRRNGS